MSRLHRHELQAAFNRVKAAVDELGRLIEAPANKPNLLPRRVPVGRQLCREILEAKPGLNIYQIVDEMRKRGYVFTSRNPVNSVRPLLYKSSDFNSTNGRFWLKPKT